MDRKAVKQTIQTTPPSRIPIQARSASRPIMRQRVETPQGPTGIVNMNCLCEPSAQRRLFENDDEYEPSSQPIQSADQIRQQGRRRQQISD